MLASVASWDFFSSGREIVLTVASQSNNFSHTSGCTTAPESSKALKSRYSSFSKLFMVSLERISQPLLPLSCSTADIRTADDRRRLKSALLWAYPAFEQH